MPVDLPLRKTLGSSKALHSQFYDWALMLAIASFTVALVGTLSRSPASYRDALSAAIYEDMLLSP